MATNIEQPKVSGQAALWAEAMTQNDGIAAAKLMQDNAREIASDFLASPREWKKWRDVVIRGLVPTAGPTDKLFEVNRLLMQVDREMSIFGTADPTLTALRDQVAELGRIATQAFGEAYKATNRKLDTLGPEIAKKVMPDWKLQPEIL